MSNQEKLTEEVAPGWTLKDEQELNRDEAGNTRRAMLDPQVVSWDQGIGIEAE